MCRSGCVQCTVPLYTAASCTHRCERPQVRVTAFTDRTFTFETKGPSGTYLLLKAAGIEKGADKPGFETVGKLSVKHIYEIAKARPWNTQHRLRLARA